MPDHPVSPSAVRPRVLWGGVACAVTGAATIGVGIILLSTPVAVAGCVALAVGAALAWYGGVARDARAHSSPLDEGAEVVERDVHEGTTPSARLHDDEVRARAAAQAERTERLLARPAPRRPLAPVGMVLLGGLAVWMTVSIIRLYPPETVTPTRVDGVIATVLALIAIRVAAASGPTPVSAILALVLGLALVGLGLLVASAPLVQGLRVVDGVLAVAAALLCLLSPVEERPDRRPRQP